MLIKENNDHRQFIRIMLKCLKSELGRQSSTAQHKMHSKTSLLSHKTAKLRLNEPVLRLFILHAYQTQPYTPNPIK
jgi:hypothetical protein